MDHIGNVGLGRINSVHEIRGYSCFCKIGLADVKEALIKMKIEKALGPVGSQLTFGNVWETMVFSC